MECGPGADSKKSVAARLRASGSIYWRLLWTPHFALSTWPIQVAAALYRYACGVDCDSVAWLRVFEEYIDPEYWW